MFNCFQLIYPMITLFNILTYVSSLNLNLSYFFFQNNKSNSLIHLLLSLIFLNLDGGEEIASEPIPHAEYTRMIYPYVTDRFNCLTPHGP